MHRRTLLRSVAAAGVAGLAGCNDVLGGDSTDDPTTDDPATTADPTTTPQTTTDPVRRDGEATAHLTVENEGSETRRTTVSLGHTLTPPCVLDDPGCGDPSDHEQILLESVDLAGGETREWRDLTLSLTADVDTFGAEVELLQSGESHVVKGTEPAARSLFDDPDQYTWDVEDGATYELSGTVSSDGTVDLTVESTES